MISPSDFLAGGGVPAVVAAVVLAGAWKLAGRGQLAWLAGIVAGYVAGHWALDAAQVGAAGAISKLTNPSEARDWLPLAVLLAALPACVESANKKYGAAFAWAFCLGLCLLTPWRLFRGSAYLPAMALPNVSFDTGAWSAGEAIGWIVGLGAAWFASWELVRAVPANTTPRLRATLATWVALGGAVTLALSGSFTYGQLLGVVTASLAGCGVTAAVLRLEQGPEAFAGPLVIAFGSVLALAHFFAELQLLHAGLLLVAMTAAVGWLPFAKKFSPAVGIAVRTAACLLPLAVAVTLAAMEFSSHLPEDGTLELDYGKAYSEL